MSDQTANLDQLCVTTLRMLAVDQVEQANSGHPGMPLGAAPMAYTLWSRFLNVNPDQPRWFNRDRFILSAGHGSALLYALLHLAGFDLSLGDVKAFRQWESKTAGHPEYGLTPGVEATTGPLGQGFAMGVGLAMAERFLSGVFNRPGLELMDHYTYAIVSDGDLMEGVASEAASLAGTLGLGKIVYLYDDNRITIEGDTAIAFTEDVGRRFEAYGWQVLTVEDGNDLKAIEAAVKKARADTRRPSLIKVRTHIGYCSPKQDHCSSHGEPLGGEATQATREALGWPHGEPFTVPDEARRHFAKSMDRGRQASGDWQALLAEYMDKHGDDGRRFAWAVGGKLPDDWDADVPGFGPDDGPIATRAASGKVLNALAGRLPQMIGGSADLAPSNKTLIDGSGDFNSDNPGGRNVRFGVREHAMGAIVNGMALHGGLIPYGGTFLIFSDYMRPALRLSALMDVGSIFVFTHDSIGVGEDGPTHQPIEQVMSLRAMPNMTVLRPADANETALCWRVAIERKGPVSLCLTRQKLPVLDHRRYQVAEGVRRGGYVLRDIDGALDVILIATGSEVHLALAAAEELAEKGIKARVVSMPSFEIFEEQEKSYRDSVLPPEVTARVAIEAGSTLGWWRWVGAKGAVIGVDRYGASAPGGVLFEKYGFTVQAVVDKVTAILDQEG